MNGLSNSNTVGFIGAGNMAGAMIRGLRKHGFEKGSVAAFDVDREKLQALDADCGLTLAEVEDLIADVKKAIENNNIDDI